MKRGVNAIYEPVRATFGPQGKNALLFRTMNRGNRIVNDGVTVAECQEPKDIHTRMVAQTFREACKRTVEKVGDGTTCTTILGGKLFNEVFRNLDDQNDFVEKSEKRGVISIKKEILESAERVKEQIKLNTTQIKTLAELERIAIISVEDETLGKVIAKMAWDVGLDGFIDVIEGYKGEIETEIIKGMRFPAKIAAKVFVNNPARYEMIAQDCSIIITNHAIDNAAQLAKTMQELNKTTAKIAIVAPSFSENVLVNMINATKAGYFIFPVLAPSLRTEQLEDLAVYCGAKFINKISGNKLQNVRPEDLGFFEKLVVKDSENKEDAVITGGKGTYKDIPTTSNLEENLAFINQDTIKSEIEKRLDILKSQLAETKQEQFKKLMERRIASMASAVGIIRVGDSTQASALYRKLKVEDAVFACKAALRGGFVKGGGLCLKEIADEMDETNILKTTLLAPYEQIQGSVEGGVEIGEDVIDPSEAVYYALEHATQVVANLLTVESITAEEEDMVYGTGELAIAKAITELVITEKIKEGQLKAGEEENYRDSLGGLANDEEYELLNRD